MKTLHQNHFFCLGQIVGKPGALDDLMQLTARPLDLYMYLTCDEIFK